MAKAESLTQHLKRLAIGWSLFGVLVTIPLGLASFYAFGFLSAAADITTSADAVVSAHRSQILVGDTRSAELQIRKELKLSEGDVATFVDAKNQRWLSGFDSVHIKECTPLGKVCRDWSAHTLRTFQPIYFDDQKNSLWGYLYVERNPPTDWTSAVAVATVFFFGMLIQILGMYSNLSRTMVRIGDTLSGWSIRLSSDPKAERSNEHAPFSEFEPIEAALSQLNLEISQLEAVARKEGALQTLRGFGHDILNPVARMKRILGAVASDPSGGRSFDPELFASLESNLKRLSDYAEQLKVLYKRNIGEFHRESSVTNVSDEVSALVNELSFDPIAIEKEIKFESSVEENCLAEIAPSSLGRVIENLCSNALHASKSSGTVHVSVRRQADAIQITVRDEGCGIPPNLRDYIFDPGFTSKANKGTGLGLFVVKQVCDQYRGRIDFESQVGVGTSFKVEVPKAREHELQNLIG